MRSRREHEQTRPSLSGSRLRSGALAILVALIALVSSGVQSLHMTLVAHELCRTHGQIEHAHDHAERPADDGDEAEASLASAGDPHEHCDALATEPAITAHSSAVTESLLTWPPRVDAALEDAALRRRLWLLAPKTSPPV